MQSSCERGDIMGKEKELELLTHRVYGEDEDENGNSDDPEPVIE
jgi:hypothetical protein